MWRDVLKQPSTIQNAVFPSVPSPIPSLTAARDYVRSTTSAITSAEGAQTKKLAKGKTVAFDPKKDKRLTVYTAARYPAWQDRCIDLARDAFDGMTLDVKKVSQKLDRAETKKGMPFVQGLKRRLEGGAESAQDVFERRLGFEEGFVLGEMVPGLRSIIARCKKVEVVEVVGEGKGKVVGGNGGAAGEERAELPQAAEGAVPGGPTFHFENV